MNKKIPNGSNCLFSQDEGGTRNGKIVLVEMYDKQNSDTGSRYTVKEYQSLKIFQEEEWQHKSITLKPMSDKPEYKDITLIGDKVMNLKVIGIFERVLI